MQSSFVWYIISFIYHLISEVYSFTSLRGLREGGHGGDCDCCHFRKTIIDLLIPSLCPSTPFHYGPFSIGGRTGNSSVCENSAGGGLTHVLAFFHVVCCEHISRLKCKLYTTSVSITELIMVLYFHTMGLQLK